MERNHVTTHIEVNNAGNNPCADRTAYMWFRQTIFEQSTTSKIKPFEGQL